MKAAVLYETKQPLRVEEVDLDGPHDGEVLVRIGAAGVCHSDYHFMNGDLTVGLPCVLGHEGAGVVEEVGRGVTTVVPGELPGCRCPPAWMTTLLLMWALPVKMPATVTGCVTVPFTASLPPDATVSC